MRISRTAWWIAGGIAVVPTLCVVGVMMVGRAMDEMGGGEGRLRSHAEIRELHRRFLAMSPAQHLAEARAALARFEGGDVDAGLLFEVVRHLDAMPAVAPEQVQGAPLRARVEAIRLAAVPRGVAALREAATHAPPGAPGHATRCAMFTAVRTRGGLDVFTPGAPHDETVVVNLSDCDATTLRRLSGARDALRRMNVHTVRCAHEGATLRVEDL
ncbi:MAG: hypothetical protein U0325_15335 [Polyangiales bacterium]